MTELTKLVDIVKILDYTHNRHMSNALLYAQAIMELDADMPVVLSHGTNLIPEIAFFLDLVLDRPAPVVVTGSMRPMSSVRRPTNKLNVTRFQPS